MRQVQVYIEGNKIELFEDEQINVTSSVQNIADISKVFTDFSQSFTVPASTVNNQIFKHFYQSDIGDPQNTNTLFDHNIRRNAVIEIDLTTFRRGKIQIEKANVKNGQPENYQLTFYGEIRALKDLFGEDKLNQLDLSSLEFAYTGTNIYNRIIDLATDYDVRYPLIASNRYWTYHHGTEDITQSANAIQYDELFPAVKVSKLFEAIENDYGLTFTGTFLTDPRFTNVFLYGKNTNEYSFITEAENLDFSSKVNNNDIYWSNISTQNATDFVDLATNTINVQNFDIDVTSHSIGLVLLTKSATGTVYLDVYQDGNLYQTIQTDTAPSVLGPITFKNTSGLNTNITFQLRATASMNVTMVISYEIIGIFEDGSGNYFNTTSTCQIQTATTVLSGNVSMNATLPDMTVSEFFSGVLKEFNATCVGTSENTFEILPLEDWYSQGAIVDITEYTDIDSIDIERIKLYKKIAFKYQQSESFVNRNYFKISNVEYGNMEYQFAYDGDEYTIEVPFENLLFTRSIDNANNYAILGYCLNESFNAYTPKPMLLYLYGESNDLSLHCIQFYDGTTHQDIDSFAQFGQDLTYQNEKLSLNFGADNSVIHEETIQQGLYAEYYFPYLSNLFNLKNRLVNVKTNLPISLLTNLQLNDRIIIRDKRYIINEMKSNLTTGEVNFSLYLDFRPLTSGKPLAPSFDAQCLNVPINFVNGAVSATITTSFGGVTITPSTITSSQTIVVCIPENTNTPSFILAENSDPLITEEFQNIVTENSGVQVITLTVTYTLSNGQQVANQIQILQQ
jgi:hypothetical protein